MGNMNQKRYNSAELSCVGYAAEKSLVSFDSRFKRAKS